jgi:transposase
MNIKTLGIDIAKNSFQVHGVDHAGKKIINKAITRNKLPEFINQLPPCLIGMEACGGSNYWGQKFAEMGHEVKLMSPQFVKPYVKSNKNDMVDAEAICEAVTRPNMRFVAIKNKEQQDVQSIHKVRARLVKEKTALANQIRGLLHEYGLVIPQGISYVRSELPLILEDGTNGLTPYGRDLFKDLYEQLKNMIFKVEQYDLKIEKICANNPICKLICKLPGVGSLTATAIMAHVGNIKVFKNGRELSAYLGLVPKQHSSGGKAKLLGISKRGDRYIRCLLIHGARAALFRAKNLSASKANWLKELILRRGFNRTVVALANKNARIIWALMTKGEEFVWSV